MTWLRTWWRDLQRGWSDSDLESALDKMRGAKPGGMTRLSDREIRAHLAYMRKIGRKWPFEAPK